MHQIKHIVDNNWDKLGGIRKFNEWMREHPKVKVVCMNVVPHKEHCEFYAVIDIPDEEVESYE